LRLLNWETGAETPYPGGADIFADWSILRKGWIALNYDMQTVALPDPCLGQPPVLLPGRHAAPHENPELIWLTDGGISRPYDRHGREAGSGLRVPAGWLEAAYLGAWLQWNPHEGRSTYWDRHGNAREIGGYFVIAVGGRFVLIGKHGMQEARVLDLADGTTRIIERKGFSLWGRLATTSPDGRIATLSSRIDDPGPWRRDQPQRPATSVMVFVDLEAASCTVASGTIEESASYPVWTSDGTSCVFRIPFGSTIGSISLSTMAIERRHLPATAGKPIADLTCRMRP